MVVFGHLRANQNSEQGANARGDLLSVRVELLLDEREVVRNHLGHRLPRLLGDTFHLLDQGSSSRNDFCAWPRPPAVQLTPAGCPGKRSVCTKSLNRGTITTRNGTGRSRRRTRFEDEGKRERAPNTVTEAHEEAEE